MHAKHIERAEKAAIDLLADVAKMKAPRLRDQATSIIGQALKNALASDYSEKHEAWDLLASGIRFLVDARSGDFLKTPCSWSCLDRWFARRGF